MPVLRRWWCLLLLENNSLNSYGKVFAHWTEECQDLLDGKHSPVFRLKRKRVQDTEANIAEKAPDDDRLCMAEPFKFCVFQTSKNTGQRLLYPDVKCLQWLQCQTCKGWLHQDCAGEHSKVLGNGSFDCGCTDSPDSTGFGKLVGEEEILSRFPGHMIKALHEDLTTGKVLSNRMYLWQNPMSSLSLKQHLKLRTLNLSDQRIFQILRAIEDATGVGSLIRKGRSSSWIMFLMSCSQKS
ncbi:hypothetical protein OJAV_G00128400 [Oryzias javanicus]|uniref:Zinc finger PHD-type domain-containing protein n=1 Tax=Oryzias javanicus TaxID=123683 RepID=A0A437CPH5_ORYJA|nr:hypothetical protein OJAV_G00128400 [Oryzias javanicus]